MIAAFAARTPQSSYWRLEAAEKVFDYMTSKARWGVAVTLLLAGLNTRFAAAAARPLAPEMLALCEERGLGPVLARMPGGITHYVGETGWQLSHGERSRIFLARALLQGAHLTVLDESFAALDPETLALCLECSLKRARTLMVIAHP